MNVDGVEEARAARAFFQEELAQIILIDVISVLFIDDVALCYVGSLARALLELILIIEHLIFGVSGAGVGDLFCQL